MNRAEKELATLIEQKEQRIAQKKTLKTLKDKYGEFSETRARLAANETEITEIKQAIIELEKRLAEIDSSIIEEEEKGKLIEQALSI